MILPGVVVEKYIVLVCCIGSAIGNFGGLHRQYHIQCLLNVGAPLLWTLPHVLVNINICASGGDQK